MWKYEHQDFEICVSHPTYTDAEWILAQSYYYSMILALIKMARGAGDEWL
jgi:hypothetical protein